MTGDAQPTPASEATTRLLGDLSEAQKKQLSTYVDELLVVNTSFNLTAIRDRQDAWERHILESLELVPYLGKVRNVIDVGSGGGLPGMVLAIARPELQLTLLEATGKKARFLEATGIKLKLSNLVVVNDRAEKAGAVGSPLRESFDLVTARAVAPLPTLLELTVPFLRVGGSLLFVKGMKADAELAQAETALKVLGCELSNSVRQSSATLLIFAKTRATGTRYPRRSGEPKHRPIGE